MTTVNLENQNKKRRIDLSKIKKVAALTLKSLSESNAEINVIIVSNQKIRVLNRKYFKRDRSTDVIAFPSGEDNFKKKGKSKKEKVRKFLGDIAISSDKAVSNAKVYETRFIEEMALYAIHGILHLLGYEDGTRKDRDLMRKREDELLQKVKKSL